MSDCHQYHEHYTRRDFLTKTSLGLGAITLGHLLDPLLLGAKAGPVPLVGHPTSPLVGGPHFAPKVKRVIYLFQSGAPSQVDLFDHKPELRALQGQDLPPSVRQGQRLTGMSAGQKQLPIAASPYNFQQFGQSGAWVSDLLPYTSKIVDELCFIKSMYTEAINHDPAVTFVQTGSQQPGRPSIGSWISYGLGSDNENLPAFCVLLSQGSGGGGQPLYDRLWGNGFLPSHHQGVQFRAGKDAVLYLGNPAGISAESRANQLEHLKKLQEDQFEEEQDPEIQAKIAQYEMAFRMQTSVPETMDLSDEPDHIFELYGPDSRVPGTFAANCLLARRLVERDVKFVQLYHRGWDHHGNLPGQIPRLSRQTDQGSAALVMDLKQRGLLDDTLVIWGGEFGRTTYSQGKLRPDNFGRDHHPRCFTIWMAGGGIKKGLTYGLTDDFSYNILKDPVHVHDFQATLMHLLGVDHEKLTYKHQGRRFRLTDVHGKVVRDILS
ncbi:DUF1501 domain-containing protein [Flavilitoribacter nigricans]|nr:DUF1501 domain-containing protein [Flavilitoribacter nigricans]